jgi:signal transduction histidine kinase
MATAVLEGTAVWIESRAAFTERYPSIDQVDSRSHAWAALPLVVDHHLLGGLGLSFTEERTFSAEERWFMLALAQQCAQALERARLYEQERQARAQAEEAVQARDHMFRLISHDLRAPLTTIQGYAHLLKRRLSATQPLDTDQFIRGLDNIEAATSRMAGQIQELLDVALLHGGQSLALNLEHIDLVRLAEHVVESCQNLSERHTMCLDTDNTRLICSGDSMRLERVLTNLLTNAIKYSPHGGEVVVTLSRQQQNGYDQAVLHVSDTGIGIPAADIPKLFTPFQRGSNVSDKMKGTGLGLASVRQIIELHHGTIDVSSTEGQGTTFIIRLPLLEEEPDT